VEARERTRSRESRVAGLGFLVAVVATLLALVANNITLTGGYRTAVIAAVGWSAGAILLIVVAWGSLPLPLKIVGLALLAANCWTLSDAAFRRLPAILR